jgi:hypothetical protein
MDKADDTHETPAPQRVGPIGWLGLVWLLVVYCYYYVQWVNCFLGGGYVERYMKLVLGR